MIEFLDAVLGSGQFWAGVIWCFIVGAALLLLSGWIEEESQLDWAFLVPGIPGAILLFGGPGTMILALFARFTAFVFTGV